MREGNKIDTVEIEILANVENATSGLQSFITQLGVAYVSYQTLTNFMKSSFSAFLDSEKASTQLAAALISTGQSSAEALSSLKNYASEMQDVSIFSRMSTEAASALLIEIGRLSVEGVQALMPHLMDFSAATGLDLVTAARMAAASMEGGRNAFIQYGISLKDAHDPTSKMTELIQKLTEKFPNMSAAIAQTTGGQLTIYKNQMNDAKVATGGLLAYFAQGYIDWLKNFAGGIKMVADEARKLWAAWTDITNLKPIGSTLAAWNAPSTQALSSMMTPASSTSKSPLVISPPEADAEANGIDKILMKYGQLNEMSGSMAVTSEQLTKAFNDNAAAIAKAHEELQKLIKDTDSYTVAAFKSTSEQEKQDSEMEKTAKAIKDVNDYLNEIGDTIVSTGGKDLATLFQEMGSGDAIAASLQKMGAELGAQIGEMMIAAGLQLIIGGNFPPGLPY